MNRRKKAKTAKGVANYDIKIALHLEGKCFLAYSKTLTKEINKIVHAYLKEQEAKS